MDDATEPSLVALLAYSKNNIVATDSSKYSHGLPWNCPDDLRFYQRYTMGNIVIMGRKTFESIGSKPLIDRYTIVVSKTLEPKTGRDHNIVSSLHEAIDYAMSLKLKPHIERRRLTKTPLVVISGGLNIYRQALDHPDLKAVVANLINVYVPVVEPQLGPKLMKAIELWSNHAVEHSGSVSGYHSAISGLLRTTIFTKQLSADADYYLPTKKRDYDGTM